MPTSAPEQFRSQSVRHRDTIVRFGRFRRSSVRPRIAPATPVKLKTEDAMANVYVEPEPRGRPEGSPITHYVLEYAHGARVTNVNYSTQAAAVTAAKQAGHRPLIARVRNTDKGNPDHWRAA